jgi:hypothetical protein
VINDKIIVTGWTADGGCQTAQRARIVDADDHSESAETLLAPSRSSLQQLLRVRAISGISPDHFYEAVCDLIDGKDGGVQSKNTCKERGVLTDLVLGDVMPDREHKILALIHPLPEQGVDFGLSPLLGEEVGRHDDDAKPTSGDTRFNFLADALPDLHLQLVKPDRDTALHKRIS